MNVWVDAQFSPVVAAWLTLHCGVTATPLRDLGLREASDLQVFQAAKQADAVVMTKDVDFIQLLERLGSPPKVIWITCGNTSNARMIELLGRTFAIAVGLLESGESLVEIRNT